MTRYLFLMIFIYSNPVLLYYCIVHMLVGSLDFKTSLKTILQFENYWSDIFLTVKLESMLKFVCDNLNDVMIHETILLIVNFVFF